MIYQKCISRWVAVLLSIVYFIVISAFDIPSLSVEASGVDNIVARADYMYNTTWTAQTTVAGWKTTFYKGNTYHIPYGQPATEGEYIGFSVSVETFLSATKDATSIFYTKQSYWTGTGTKSTFYASDCSAFVSYCWGVSRTTTANWKNLNVTSLGSAGNSLNVSKIQAGDALNSPSDTGEGHVVLVTAVNTDGTYEITEQTNPQMKRTTYTTSQICSKYSAYTIYRYNNRDNVPAPPNYEPLTTPTITTDKSTYTVGDTVSLTWASSSSSNLSHYWLTIGCPDGTTLLNETMNKNTSYSFTVTQEGTYSVTAAATPLGSVNGEGSLYYNVQIPVKPANYTVTLNANGGSVSPTSIMVSANGIYSGLPNPSKTGYTFAGWYTALTGGTKKENGSSLASNSNHTLYAHWTANTYKIAFNANGGSGSMNTQTLTYDTASTLTANAFTRTGYSFTGWNTKSDGSGTAYSNKASVKNLTTSGTVTLYAQWTAGGYTIAYNANGGTGTMSSQSMKYDQTANLTVNAFTRTGYTFAGWNTKADGSGTSYADKASVKNLAASGTVTLYAKWTANKYTVKFDGNGTDELSKTSMEVTYNSVYGEFPEPKREGYNFIGWYTQPEGGTAISPNTKVTITSTQTLYAQWSQVKFLITFNATGGTSESSQKLVTYDKAYGVLPTAERTGYTFKGWYLDEACTKQITSDTTVVLTANQEVYAKWELRRYLITFDATGGTAERESKQVTFGKTYGVLPSATKDGDEFIGWFTEDGTEITSSSIVEIESDTTLYAKWASDDVIGDVNADGVFNVADVVMMQKWLLCAGDLTDWQAGDLCRDDRIDVFDLCLMKRMLIER